MSALAIGITLALAALAALLGTWCVSIDRKLRRLRQDHAEDHEDTETNIMSLETSVATLHAKLRVLEYARAIEDATDELQAIIDTHDLQWSDAKPTPDTPSDASGRGTGAGEEADQ